MRFPWLIPLAAAASVAACNAILGNGAPLVAELDEGGAGAASSGSPPASSSSSGSLDAALDAASDAAPVGEDDLPELPAARLLYVNGPDDTQKGTASQVPLWLDEHHPEWKPGPPLPAPFQNGAAFHDGNRVYLFGGTLGGISSGSLLSSIAASAALQTDGALGEWISESPLPATASGRCMGRDSQGQLQVLCTENLTQLRTHRGTRADGGLVWSTNQYVLSASSADVAQAAAASGLFAVGANGTVTWNGTDPPLESDRGDLPSFDHGCAVLRGTDTYVVASSTATGSRQVHTYLKTSGNAQRWVEQNGVVSLQDFGDVPLIDLTCTATERGLYLVGTLDLGGGERRFSAFRARFLASGAANDAGERLTLGEWTPYLGVAASVHPQPGNVLIALPRPPSD